jgi:hypothetical protein
VTTMTWLVIASALIVLVGVLGLLTLAQAAKQYRDWDTPPLKAKRQYWRRDMHR